MEEGNNQGEIGKGFSTANDPVGLCDINFDFSVSPSTDFYQYTNGGWMEKNPLPDDFSRFGVFDKVIEKSIFQRKELITTLSDHPQSNVKDTDAQKIKDIYELGMDTVRLNQEGASPILPFVERIKSADITKLEQLVSWLHLGITSTFFSSGIGPDQRNSDKYLLNIGYPGLGLGDRDYYIVENEENSRLLSAYETFVKEIMRLIGYDDDEAQRVWNNVLKLEKGFAQHKRSKEALRNPNLQFNIMRIDEFKKRYSNFDWNIYLNNLGIENIDELNVMDPDFLDYINTLLPKLTEQEIKDLFVFDLVSDSTGVLSEEFENADFELYGKAMMGTEEQQPRWKRIMGVPNSLFGEILGKLYVEKYFPKENKDYMVGLVEDLRSALKSHIMNLSWMTDSTKRKALDKLDNLKVKIGYPDKWKDYSDIHVDPEKSFHDNIYNASVALTKKNYSKLSQLVDKEEWLMNPQSVNAYYNPTSNEICFPAGILQPPFFNINADAALNYGRIGVIIGHEMTHGFDDRGRHYDKDGNLTDWWQPEDAKQFNKLSDALAEQFDSVEVSPGVKANGRYTLGENIADQGGIRLALTAYLNSNYYHPTERIGGFDPVQRFFIAYSNVWAENIRPESIPVRTKIDTHSLGKVRVNETLRNIDSFMDSFSITDKDPMYRPENERTIIW